MEHQDKDRLSGGQRERASREPGGDNPRTRAIDLLQSFMRPARREGTGHFQSFTGNREEIGALVDAIVEAAIERIRAEAEAK